MGAQGGALIVGSLFWERTPERIGWRTQDLQLNDRTLVKAPIRYGRFSKKWGSYTMTFSNSLSFDQYGQAYAVPHITKTHNKMELNGFALRMARAEGISVGLTSSWGSVGLLINPSSPFSEDLLSYWNGAFKPISERNELMQSFIPAEEPPINANGYLEIPWPMCKNGSPLKGFDYLIATATLPRHKEGGKAYPLPNETAMNVRWGKDNDYFSMNIANHITTFEDSLISKYAQQI